MNAPIRTSNATSELAALKVQLDARESSFKGVLPAHIPAARFMRVVMVACQTNSDLLMRVSRDSLFNAALRAASDGLLPDGREGAIVEFKGKAAWMPMIAGLRKKARNSGEIETWDAHVVFENDEFDYQLGDDPYIKHKPAMGARGKPICAYSIATLKGGEKSREVMSMAELEKVRAVSRARDTGPWRDWPEEMMRKTVARRHSKVLPSSTDLDDLMRSDDYLYGSDESSKGARADGNSGIADKLRALASAPHSPHVELTAASADASNQNPPSPDYEVHLIALDAEFGGVTTLEVLNELAERHGEEWFNAAPDAIRRRGETIYARHKQRIEIPAATLDGLEREIEAAELKGAPTNG